MSWKPTILLCPDSVKPLVRPTRGRDAGRNLASLELCVWSWSRKDCCSEKPRVGVQVLRAKAWLSVIRFGGGGFSAKNWVLLARRLFSSSGAKPRCFFFFLTWLFVLISSFLQYQFLSDQFVKKALWVNTRGQDESQTGSQKCFVFI